MYLPGADVVRLFRSSAADTPTDPSKDKAGDADANARSPKPQSLRRLLKLAAPELQALSGIIFFHLMLN